MGEGLRHRLVYLIKKETFKPSKILVQNDPDKSPKTKESMET